MIFALLTLLASIAVTFSKKIQKRFKNKTLTFISLSYIMACIIIGIVTNILTNNISITIILLMYAVMKMSSSIWYVLENKYLKNFTTDEIRNRITFTYSLIVCTVASILSIIGSTVLKQFGIDKSFLFIGLVAFVLIVLTLKYMKPRFGLRPNEYKKEDIEFTGE